MSDIKGNVVNVQVSGPASAVKAKKLAKPRKITLGGDLVDVKYIPDTIQRVGADVIINSSTSGSTKKFKLAVDDTGTLSATEVTDS